MIVLEVSLADSVASLKEKIEKAENVPVNTQKLVFEGKELVEGVLVSYNITPQSTIDLVLESLANKSGKDMSAKFIAKAEQAERAASLKREEEERKAEMELALAMARAVSEREAEEQAARKAQADKEKASEKFLLLAERQSAPNELIGGMGVKADATAGIALGANKAIGGFGVRSFSPEAKKETKEENEAQENPCLGCMMALQ